MISGDVAGGLERGMINLGVVTSTPALKWLNSVVIWYFLYWRKYNVGGENKGIVGGVYPSL